MPTIANHQSNRRTRLLLIGDSGAGKTGSIMSLAAAGYKIRMLDLDDGADLLRDYAISPGSPYVRQNPKVAENIIVKTIREPMRSIAGKPVPAKGIVWEETIKMIANWREPEENIDLGPVTSWDEDCVLVIDSLTKLAEAALIYHMKLNGCLGGTRTQNEARRDIGAAQNYVRDLLNMIADNSVKCNVIVMSHITMVSEVGAAPKVTDGELQGPLTSGYPSAIGRALSPQIPRWFNSMLVLRTVGSGQSAKHLIYTSSQNVAGQIINAKTSAPTKALASYPLETGLADYFKHVRS